MAENIRSTTLSSLSFASRLGSTDVTEGCPFTNPSQLFEDFKNVREQEQLQYSDVLGGHVVTRYDDIVHVLDHPELFSSRVTVPEPPSFVLDIFHGRIPMRGTLLGHDNPDHDRLRRSVGSFFVPRRLQRFEPAIRELASELVDGFVEQGRVDVKNEFALPLPLKVVSLVAGLDPKRWKWLGQSLALFGGHAAMANGTFEEKTQRIIDLHEYIAELIQERKTDRRDDLISHIWNERDADVVEMTDFEHLSMIPGLLLAGHETTTNLLSMGITHLLERGIWNEATKDKASRNATIEELLRFESAITGMRREVMSQTRIGATSLQPGDVLFVAFNSGSRDPKHFTSPDVLHVGRKLARQHLGFGRGIHACLGAPLARLLLNVELEVIRDRLPGLRLKDGFQKQYDRVSEARGIHESLIEWNPDRSKRQLAVPSKARSLCTIAQPKIEVTVSKTQVIADGIMLLSLIPAAGGKLPLWTPGAHIDLPVGEFGFRQYSLCSDPNDVAEWKVAVSLNVQGTGGSAYVHRAIPLGSSIQVSQPRNHFPLRDSDEYLFIAGGIGITPIRAMVISAKLRGVPYRLVYLGSHRSRMAFADELETDGQVTLWPKDECGTYNLVEHLQERGILEVKNARRHRIYACGPTRLLEALETACANLPAGVLNMEHFENINLTSPGNTENRAFEVELEQSGRKLQVPAERSLLEVLNENGCGVMSTCTKGTCGTCEVEVVDGQVEHRDTVLTNEEKKEGKTIMTCVSRCAGERLVLDLW